MATIIQAVSPLLGAGGVGAASALASEAWALSSALASAPACTGAAALASAGASALAGASAAAVDAAGVDWASASVSDAAHSERLSASPSTHLMLKNLFIRIPFALECACTQSDRRLTGLTGADSDHLIEAVNKDLSVSNFSGSGGLFDGFECAFQQGLWNCNFELDLG